MYIDGHNGENPPGFVFPILWFRGVVFFFFFFFSGVKMGNEAGGGAESIDKFFWGEIGF